MESLNTLVELIGDHIKYRKQLFKLAKSDVIKQYRGAALGWSWAIIKPATTIFVYWFAFALGIRKGKLIDGYPFFLWMIVGMIPWFYIRDSLNSGSASIRKYKYLVKKIKYPVGTIPTFVSLSHLSVNIMLQVIMLVIFFFYGERPSVYYWQIIIINIAMFTFWTSWSLFASMLSAISSDFLNLVKSAVPALFWLSGVLYPAARLKNHLLRDLLLWNPVTITANAYRNAIIYNKWIWEAPTEMRNYMVITVVIIALSVWAYWRLRKEIPDVL